MKIECVAPRPPWPYGPAAPLRPHIASDGPRPRTSPDTAARPPVLKGNQKQKNVSLFWLLNNQRTNSGDSRDRPPQKRGSKSMGMPPRRPMSPGQKQQSKKRRNLKNTFLGLTAAAARSLHHTTAIDRSNHLVVQGDDVPLITTVTDAEANGVARPKFASRKTYHISCFFEPSARLPWFWIWFVLAHGSACTFSFF